MAHWTHMTEHAGAKNGGGFYGTRVEAKTSSKVGRRQNDRWAIEEGLSEVAEVEAEATAQAHNERIIAAATLRVEDVAEGDLYRVIKVEAWESPREMLVTRSVERAVAAFNAAVLSDGWFDEVALVVNRCNDLGDFEFADRICRDRVGDKLVSVG